jgi:L-asparagine transporter-like permease
MSAQPASNGIPMPIVTLNRSVLLTGIILGYILHQPLFTTALFLVVLPAVLWGQKASLIYFVGSRLFRKLNQNAATESPLLMRFNNSIAVIMLGVAQFAFLFGATTTAWIISGMVALAAFVALCGFCFGCFLYFQFNMQRYRLFGKKSSPGVDSLQVEH